MAVFLPLHVPNNRTNGTAGLCIHERANGIEPSARAWEARVLPLYDARRVNIITGDLGCATTIFPSPAIKVILCLH